MTHEDLRQAVFERDNFTCQYCGRYGRGVKLEIDHIIPVSKGGATDIRNLITACRECNRAKRNRLLTVGELQEIADKINTSLEYLISLADRPPAPAEEAVNNPVRKEAEPIEETAKPEQGKSARLNFWVNERLHSALMSLAYLKGQTMTAILTEAIEAYIQGYSEEIAVLQETRRKLRGK